MEQVAMGKVPRGEGQWVREGRNRQEVTEERWPWRLQSARFALTSHTCAGGAQIWSHHSDVLRAAYC